MELNLHRTCWLEIDLDRIKENFRKIQEMVGDKVTVMPAVKANAYGHGVIMAVKALEEAGAKVVAVGNLDEAIKLRQFTRETDPHSFILITNSTEIIGKGFRGLM